MPASDLALLLDAATAAAGIAMEHWQRPVHRWDKTDGTPVSAADIAVNEALERTLRDARPDYGWLSEESPDDPRRLTADACFVIDPIDGTRAYLDGKRDWALSLAVVRGGRPVAGVVHMPARDAVYAAAAGQGATLNGRPIAASGQADADGARTLASRPTYADTHWRGGVPAFQRHFRSSMAWRLALIGEGRFDAMLTLRPAWEWDIAAGALIAAEAGAAVTDRHGAALVLNSADRRANGILAAPPGLHRALLARLA
ncbi:inositol monophosphatase [Oceaniovalibus guishaninsula JLT2003]|uniref:Inositol monophosphatase n=1 Tax=Oceaniovalibus guishaninsula JLT2003 TaxID=1231392 RepID=K2GQG4_9RHOB|nr:3'(2'),5'-bisphosphate nucleotidase CysQ [Oceaniovalibus guishaninsula]EKE44911.1 inositol monophosphatase [Oceaniovalibus guishaninsula JLT2003]